MTIADMVYSQVKLLPDPLAREVLDFVGFLREGRDSAIEKCQVGLLLQTLVLIDETVEQGTQFFPSISVFTIRISGNLNQTAPKPLRNASMMGSVCPSAQWRDVINDRWYDYYRKILGFLKIRESRCPQPRNKSENFSENEYQDGRNDEPHQL